MDFVIISVEPSYSSELTAGGAEVKRVVFGIRSVDALSQLPDCLPFSRAVNVDYFLDPTSTDAVLAVKNLDGVWQH